MVLFMSKNDIFTDPKYAIVDGNIYHDNIFGEKDKIAKEDRQIREQKKHEKRKHDQEVREKRRMCRIRKKERLKQANISWYDNPIPGKMSPAQKSFILSFFLFPCMPLVSIVVTILLWQFSNSLYVLTAILTVLFALIFAEQNNYWHDAKEIEEETRPK